MSDELTQAPRIGVRDEFVGIYIRHWEWPRFEMRVPRRPFGSRVVRCMLEPTDGLAWFTSSEPSGDRTEADRYHLMVDGTPVEKGHFGHRGTLSYRIEVHEWVSVNEG